MREVLERLTQHLASAVEAAAAVVIGLAAARAAARAAAVFARRGTDEATDGIRLALGRWLSLALEFELAADILRTAVAPTWTEIGQLAAIVVLRTTLNYFLQKEVASAAARRTGPAPLRISPSE